MALRLTLKKKWFDMISSGEKKEEYREIKPHWKSRLVSEVYAQDEEYHDSFRKFDIVEFRHGYSKDPPMVRVQCKDIVVGKGKKKWGAETGVSYYVIKLGKILPQ
jgi:hypothetical protein